MTLVDLIRQVQKVLPVAFGGTGNTRGWARDAIVGEYMNGTGSTITRGTLVELANYQTMGGGHIRDSRIKPTTEANTQTVVGVVIGRIRLSDPVGEYQDADVLDAEIAAVVIAGKALVRVTGSALVGDFAYSSSTDGTARAATYLEAGGMGTFESADSGGYAWVRLWGAPATPGVYGAVLINFGDGIVALQAGTKVDFVVPANLRLTRWTLLADVSGACSIDLYQTTYANHPADPPDSITGGEPPTIVSVGNKGQADVPWYIDSFGSEQGWQRDLDKGEVVRAIVESSSGIKQVSLTLEYVRR